MRKEKKKNRIKYLVNTLENSLKTRLFFTMHAKMVVTNEIDFSQNCAYNYTQLKCCVPDCVV